MRAELESAFASSADPSPRAASGFLCSGLGFFCETVPWPIGSAGDASAGEKMGEMGETGDSNGVGFVRAAIPKADDAFVAGLGETGMPWETPALALRAAAASMMRRAAARFRASGVADAEPDGEASVGASAGLRVPASGDICREGLGVEVADADRGGGGGENTKFVTGSLAALGERRRAGLAAAMMRRAAATLSMAGDARRPSSRLWGVDGNGEGGGFRGVNAPGLDALASAQ